MPTISILNQEHSSLDRQYETLLHALYAGGKKFAAQLPNLLNRRSHETPETFDLRVKEARYLNYFGPIVDYFAALVFNRDMSIVPDGEQTAHRFYADFAANCDRRGSDVEDIFKLAATRAMVQRVAWLWLRHPSGDAATAAEFAERRLGDTWITLLENSDVLDWETGDDGSLAWLMVHKKTTKRAGVESKRDDVVETWWYITAATVDTYEIAYKAGKPPSSEAEVPRKSSEPHRYGAVPVVCIDLPEGLWLGQRIENAQLSHFRLANMQQWGMSRTCYAMPVLKLDSTEKKKPEMGAGYGLMMGVKEALDWASPPSDCYDALGAEIKAVKDEIYRIAQTMALGVENNAAAVGRSAESKEQDAVATAIVAAAYAKIFGEAMKRAYALVSAARGDAIDWVVTQADDLAGVGLLGLVDILERIEAMGGIQSVTFNAEAQKRIADHALPGISDEKRKKVNDEIEAGAAIAEQLKARVAAATVKQAENPAQPDQEPKQPPQKQAA